MQTQNLPSITQIIKQRAFNWAFGGVVVAPIESTIANMVTGISGSTSASVTPQTALTYSAVYASVRAIAESISTLPFRVYDNLNGYASASPTHPINYLISTAPNDQIGKIDFLETLLASALLWGNGYARIYRNDLMRPISFHFVHAYWVKPFIDEKTGVLYYLYKDPLTEKVETLNDYDLIHIKSLSTNGIEGISMISAHKKSIGLGMAATNFGLSFFDKGANMSGVVSTDSKLGDDTVDRLRNQWNSNYSGQLEAQKTIILEQGLKYDRVGIPPNDAQFLETREFQIADVARIFRVPQHKIGKLDKSSYNTLEQQNIEWVQDTLTPWAKKLEQEFDRKCFRTDENQVYFTRFDFNSLLRGDIKTRVEAQWKWLQMGVLNPNEIRELEGMAPRTDEAGKDYYVPLNLENASNPTSDGNENK